QETSASADASVGNGAGVEQGSGQLEAGTTAAGGNGSGNGQGNGDGSGNGQDNGNGQENGNGTASASQAAHTGQQAGAAADAAAAGVANEAASVRVGPAGAGNGGGVSQSNGSRAEADACAGQSTTQGAGGASALVQGERAGDQSASAAASASATAPANDLVAVRVEASGGDAGFQQSNSAGADAEATTDAVSDESVQGSADAAATAVLTSPTNAAVELRVYSDGDTTGGRQSNAATANAIAAGGDSTAAGADANVVDAANTFVSVRVNSAGTTGGVGQETVAATSESVDGAATQTLATDPADAVWNATDADSGIAVTLVSDGQNTDLRISVDDASLVRPSMGDSFLWTWDMVLEPGAELDCAVSSSVAGGQVVWHFDCDPENRVARPADDQTVVRTQGTLTWTWSWERPELPGWVWERLGRLPIPTCAGCTYTLDFRWITYEPVAPAPAPAAAPSPALADAAVTQVNEAVATAVASAQSTVVQLAAQTSGGASERVQTIVQQAHVAQIVAARAAAQLADVLNRSIDVGGLARQANRAAANAEAHASSEIRQRAAQDARGEGSIQVQVVVQVVATSQDVAAAGVASIRDAQNTVVSIGGDGMQNVAGTASSSARTAATTDQLVEQLQTGDRSQQEQLAGQWAFVTQILESVAAAGVEGATTEARLVADASRLRVRVTATASGSNASDVSQWALQAQEGDDALQFQESLQLAIVEQAGTAIAAATGGGTLRYATPARGVAPPASEPAVARRATVATATAAVEVVIAVTAAAATVRPRARTVRHAAPRLRAEKTARHRATTAPTRLGTPFTQLSAPRPDGGTTLQRVVLHRGDGAGSASSGTPRPRCPAPPSFGATAGSAGTPSGGAFAVLARYVLRGVQGPGRLLPAPAGRRPAAVLLKRTRPG
ncbi:MAG TPA: hypothetical protein VK874_15560, partial [Gaiellaceae bacterium]|nr:hypothetical protein [Gaiellaceae bacterium]